MSEDSNVVSMGYAPHYPEVQNLMRDLARVVNEHLHHVPIAAVVGSLDMIKMDLTMQAMDVEE